MQKTILKIGVTFLSGFLSTFCVAQYYYNDVISTTLTNNKYLLLRQLKVQSVIAKAYSSNNELIDDFTLSKTINATTNIVVGTIKTNANSESVSTEE